jgi:hypothetical protein
MAPQLGDAFESIIKGGAQEVLLSSWYHNALLIQRQIDVLEWFTRTALELIAQSGLGYSIDPLTDESDTHPYIAATKEVGYGVPLSFI